MRALDDGQIKMLILDLLKNPSERDKQRLIGASEIGNKCEFCLANRLIGTPKKGGIYWLAAKVGTAIHAELENEEDKHVVSPANYRFVALKSALIEKSIVLGEIEGYGVIKSKPDLVLVESGNLIDHKTSTKQKVKLYKLDGVPWQYIVQQQLYAWGLNKSGVPISRISLSFINRDGGTDDDIWIHSFDYDESIAEAAWKRLTLIWEWLQDGGEVASLDSDSECYYCTRVLGRF